MKELTVLKSQITAELEKLRVLRDEADAIAKKKGANIDIRAGGSILHDFYCGAENIFHAIATAIDESVPAGLSWHIELLNQMTLNIENIRSAVITKETARTFEEYLRFRHLFRKRYGFELEWAGIKRLLKHLPSAYKALKKDIASLFEG